MRLADSLCLHEQEAHTGWGSTELFEERGLNFI